MHRIGMYKGLILYFIYHIQVRLSTILEDLVCLQDFHLNLEQSSDIMINAKVR